MKIERRKTSTLQLGPVAVGGNAPVSVQTMTKCDTRDTEACLAQLRSVAELGCDIARLAVPDAEAAQALRTVRAHSPLPLVADIHFDHKLAITALDAGMDGLRINPGNIGGDNKLREVVQAAQERKAPIRIGVNAGSLEKDLLHKHGGATAEAMVESALRHVHLLEDCGYDQIKVSVKASDVPRTLAAYRSLARQTRYPLHLGVTEAGTFLPGAVRSSVALGCLLSEGIGDTLRVSLTDTPEREVRTGLELLRCLGLREPGPSVVSCPACGRKAVDVQAVAEQVESALHKLYCGQTDMPRPIVAVMGCRVNGPGEAREADIALAGGSGKFALYVNGVFAKTVPESKAVDSLLDYVIGWQESMRSRL